MILKERSNECLDIACVCHIKLMPTSKAFQRYMVKYNCVNVNSPLAFTSMQQQNDEITKIWFIKEKLFKKEPIIQKLEYVF